MHLNRQRVSIVTSTSGADSEYTSDPVNGLVHSVVYTASTSAALSSTCAVTITSETGGLTIYTTTNMNSTGFTVCPRLVDEVIDSTGGQVGTTDGNVAMYPVYNERILVTVTEGTSDSLGGTFDVYVMGG